MKDKDIRDLCTYLKQQYEILDELQLYDEIKNWHDSFLQSETKRIDNSLKDARTKALRDY